MDGVSSDQTVRRLYYDDCYGTEFTARVLRTADEGRRVYLDQTLFYPSSGGQPFDLGQLGPANVIEVVDEEGQIAHVLDAPLTLHEVQGKIDWARRYDHMQQHTGQHLLSAVFAEHFGLPTVGFHLGSESSTIDLDSPAVSPETLTRAEALCNEAIWRNAAISIGYEDAEAAADLRKASERSGTLRIVTIQGVDRSACGGTHLRATGEIGSVLLRRTEKVKNKLRVEFVCGGRAVRRSRAEFEALSGVARLQGGQWQDAPATAERQAKRLQEAEKAAQLAGLELAKLQGAQAFRTAAPDADGIRRLWMEEALSDNARAFAQAFTAGGDAVAVILSAQPAAALVAVSNGGKWNAGSILKSILQECGGRGGGSATLAQGTAPEAERLAQRLRQEFGFVL